MTNPMAMDLGKENICPLTHLYQTQTQSLSVKSCQSGRSSSSRRSPLPRGFPRSPLQDITHHILSPYSSPISVNSLQILPWEQVVDTQSIPVGSRNKRFKSDAASQSIPQASLRLCTSSQTEIEISQGVDPKKSDPHASDPEIRAMDSLDCERQLDVIHVQCSHDNGAPSPAQLESSSVENGEALLTSPSPQQKTSNKKRKQIMVSVLPTTSSISTESVNTDRSKTKARSSIMRFR